MKTRTSTQIAAVITVALAVSIAYANGFEELYSVGTRRSSSWNQLRMMFIWRGTVSSR